MNNNNNNTTFRHCVDENIETYSYMCDGGDSYGAAEALERFADLLVDNPNLDLRSITVAYFGDDTVEYLGYFFNSAEPKSR